MSTSDSTTGVGDGISNVLRHSQTRTAYYHEHDLKTYIIMNPFIMRKRLRIEILIIPTGSPSGRKHSSEADIRRQSLRPCLDNKLYKNTPSWIITEKYDLQL